ncbi:hypothetical protein [Pseudanabaena sp. PCC 6802]|uniref:hypothetical protein n=1 Tax=Pseudanabaena sp. PCC 6802 TaxID=118173 RepID=UPI00034DD640|nr:hypothetical protein [Pseudanabaena sp. PCC 6802]
MRYFCDRLLADILALTVFKQISRFNLNQASGYLSKKLLLLRSQRVFDIVVQFYEILLSEKDGLNFRNNPLLHE